MQSKSSARKPKKTKRKKLRTLSSGQIESLGVDLADIQDDIVDPSTDLESDQENKTHQHMMRSQPVGKLYVEQSRGFTSVKSTTPLRPPVTYPIPPPVEFLKSNLHLINGFKATDQMAMEEKYENKRNRGSDVEEAVFPIKTTSMVFALQTIQGFKTFSHFCMGILAGVAVWQTVYCYTMTSDSSFVDSFLRLYQYSSVPINSVFYMLLVWTTVATFDRYDIAKLNRQFLLQACTLQSGAIACVLYTAALCINVSLAPLDDRLGLRVNATTGTDGGRDFPSTEARDNHLMTWKVLTIFRAVLVTLAWFIISIRPGTSRLTKNLSKSEVTWANSNEQHDMKPTGLSKKV